MENKKKKKKKKKNLQRVRNGSGHFWPKLRKPESPLSRPILTLSSKMIIEPAHEIINVFLTRVKHEAITLECVSTLSILQSKFSDLPY